MGIINKQDIFIFNFSHYDYVIFKNEEKIENFNSPYDDEIIEISDEI